MSKIKEYNNVFAKMIEYHNIELVPLIKKLKRYGPVKISRIRCLQYRDRLETSDKALIDNNIFIEYFITNYFIVKLLDEEEKNTCLALVTNTSDKTNYLMGVSALYNLIETKKEELLKLK